MLDCGAFTTITPAWVAALTSTLSRPTPARATTLSRRAAADASASTVVALRTRSASASTTAASSAGRSVPSTLRTSKSGPRASTVAGDSLGDEHDRAARGGARGGWGHAGLWFLEGVRGVVTRPIVGKAL